MDLRAPVENFFTDVAPAPLPVAPAPVRQAPAPTRNPTPPPAAKSHYDASELDGVPRLLRHGSASFPSSLARKGVRRGTVTFEVEISTSGSVSIRKVISSTHSELISPARRVAASARFTPPKRNGEVVKAIMRWPIVIQK
jgi:TonB family protein